MIILGCFKDDLKCILYSTLLKPGVDKVRERGAPLPGNDKEK